MTVKRTRGRPVAVDPEPAATESYSLKRGDPMANGVDGHYVLDVFNEKDGSKTFVLGEETQVRIVLRGFKPAASIQLYDVGGITWTNGFSSLRPVIDDNGDQHTLTNPTTPSGTATSSGTITVDVGDQSVSPLTGTFTPIQFVNRAASGTKGP
jgi:hypothetical protein